MKNQALAANTWSNNYSGLAKGIFHQNIFGVTFGGPIARNKLFFFVNYEGVRNNAAPNYVSAVDGIDPDTSCGESECFDCGGNYLNALAGASTPTFIDL